MLFTFACNRDASIAGASPSDTGEKGAGGEEGDPEQGDGTPAGELQIVTRVSSFVPPSRVAEGRAEVGSQQSLWISPDQIT